LNKKILVSFVALLILSITLTPFALARPWNEKNNEKFLKYNVVVGFDYSVVFAAAADPEYVPSEDKPNKMIISWEEVATSDYTITIDGIGTYVCGTDFEYSGVAVYTCIGETSLGPMGLPVGDKQNKFRVDYMYDFGDGDGGIDGTLSMLAVTAQDEVMWITSVGGTGDLQNVQVFATSLAPGHDGIVIGWPNIPPV
jgi:hypothetical protein